MVSQKNQPQRKEFLRLLCGVILKIKMEQINKEENSHFLSLPGWN